MLPLPHLLSRQCHPKADLRAMELAEEDKLHDRFCNRGISATAARSGVDRA